MSVPVAEASEPVRRVKFVRFFDFLSFFVGFRPFLAIFGPFWCHKSRKTGEIRQKRAENGLLCERGASGVRRQRSRRAGEATPLCFREISEAQLRFSGLFGRFHAVSEPFSGFFRAFSAQRTGTNPDSPFISSSPTPEPTGKSVHMRENASKTPHLEKIAIAKPETIS